MPWINSTDDIWLPGKIHWSSNFWSSCTCKKALSSMESHDYRNKAKGSPVPSPAPKGPQGRDPSASSCAQDWVSCCELQWPWGWGSCFSCCHLYDSSWRGAANPSSEPRSSWIMLRSIKCYWQVVNEYSWPLLHSLHPIQALFEKTQILEN